MGGIFGGQKQATPTISAPAPMPDENSASSLEAKRRAAQDVADRAGRSSTILTGSKRGSTDREYSSKVLG